MANIQIPITENGTVTLATAGKYCDRNIDVTVEVAAEGAALETVTLNIINNNESTPSMVVGYLSAEQTLAWLAVFRSKTAQIQVVKNSIILFQMIGNLSYDSSDMQVLSKSYGEYCVVNDCTVINSSTS